MVNTARRLDIFEIFDKVSKAKTKKEKMEILRHNDCVALRDVCRGFFDESIQWTLPPGKPPYVANLPKSVPSTLLKQNKQFKYFVKGGVGDQVAAYKREQIFISVLESIHPLDAEILIDMINKTPVKGITKPLIEESFPGLIVR